MFNTRTRRKVEKAIERLRSDIDTMTTWEQKQPHVHDLEDAIDFLEKLCEWHKQKEAACSTE